MQIFRRHTYALLGIAAALAPFGPLGAQILPTPLASPVMVTPATGVLRTPANFWTANATDIANAAATAFSDNAIAISKVNGLQPALDGKQPLDSDLTSIAALSTTSFGRSLLTQSDATALRSTEGLVIGTNVLAPNGSGVNLTALNATQLTSGTVPVARLPVATTSTAGAVPGLGGATSTNAATIAQADAANLDGERISLGTLSTAGNTDVSASAATKRRVFAEAEIAQPSGTLFIRTITLTSTNAQAGDTRTLRIALTQTDNYGNPRSSVEIRNLTSGGALLARLIASRITARTVTLAFTYDGTNWVASSPEQVSSEASWHVAEVMRASRSMPLDFLGGSSSVSASGSASGTTVASGWTAGVSTLTANSAARWRTAQWSPRHGNNAAYLFANGFAIGGQLSVTKFFNPNEYFPTSRLRLGLYAVAADITDAAGGASVGIPTGAQPAVGMELRDVDSGATSQLAWWGWTWDGSTLTYYDLSHTMHQSGSGQGGRGTEWAIHLTPEKWIEFWVAGKMRLRVQAATMPSGSAYHSPAFQISATTGATPASAGGNFSIQHLQGALVTY